MADIRNDDLEDILAGMLDEQDRSNGRQSPAAKLPELPRRGAAAAPAASVAEDAYAALGGARRRNPVPSRSLPHPGIRPLRVPRVLPSGTVNLSSPHAVPPPHRPTRPRPAP